MLDWFAELFICMLEQLRCFESHRLFSNLFFFFQRCNKAQWKLSFPQFLLEGKPMQCEIGKKTTQRKIRRHIKNYRKLSQNWALIKIKFLHTFAGLFWIQLRISVFHMFKQGHPRVHFRTCTYYYPIRGIGKKTIFLCEFCANSSYFMLMLA